MARSLSADGRFNSFGASTALVIHRRAPCGCHAGRGCTWHDAYSRRDDYSSPSRGRCRANKRNEHEGRRREGPPSKYEAGDVLCVAGFLVSGVSGEKKWCLSYTRHRRRVIQFQNEALILRVDQIVPRGYCRQPVEMLPGCFKVPIGGDPKEISVLQAFEDIERVIHRMAPVNFKCLELASAV